MKESIPLAPRQCKAVVATSIMVGKKLIAGKNQCPNPDGTCRYKDMRAKGYKVEIVRGECVLSQAQKPVFSKS